MNLFQEEKNKLLESFIDRYQRKADAVEIIISSECNQACEYCYLFKHGHKMYPKESNQKENILNNLKVFLDYLYEKEFEFKSFDLFSGEFFQLEFWEDIFEIIYNHPIAKQKLAKERILSIPTNFSFLLEEGEAEKIEKWIVKFHEDTNIEMFLSCSVDGPEELEELERPIKGYPQIKQKDFYQKMFNFLKKYNFTPHPMITKNFVLNYKQNYDFWIDNIIENNNTFIRDEQRLYNIPMFLEVRDPDQWDSPEILEKYRDFLFYMAEKDLNSYHNGNLEEFAMHMADDFSDYMAELGKYNKVQPYLIGIPDLVLKIPCSIQSGMVCRIGDLAIVPCHRTCYPNMIYGKFKLNEDKSKIIGVEGDKVSLAHKIQTCNPNRSYLNCSDCEIKAFCIKGCLGSQYEHTGELFRAQENVCNMLKTKYITIHEICEKYKIYDIINDNMSIPEERRRTINYARECLSRLQRSY